MERVLVPIDFSPCSLEALRNAAKLAERFRADLILVHAVEPLHPGSLLETRGFRRLHTQWKQRARRELAKLAQQQVGRQTRVRPLVRQGSPADVITALARKTNAHLVVISTHGRTGLKHVLMGSVAEKVVRHAPCPVLVVRGCESERMEASPTATGQPQPAAVRTQSQA